MASGSACVAAYERAGLKVAAFAAGRLRWERALEAPANAYNRRVALAGDAGDGVIVGAAAPFVPNPLGGDPVETGTLLIRFDGDGRVRARALIGPAGYPYTAGVRACGRSCPFRAGSPASSAC